MTITYTGSNTMTGQAALWALYRNRTECSSVPSTNTSSNFKKGFLDWCEIQNEELIANTGALG
ncbi:MAG: hypothetical protein P8J01_05995 [Acidimicrobiales bacterium]|nr:hypothetical protein [Acidimicrobiales bacterium]